MCSNCERHPGRCSYCDGVGTNIAGVDCPHCDGTGKCRCCRGFALPGLCSACANTGRCAVCVNPPISILGRACHACGGTGRCSECGAWSVGLNAGGCLRCQSSGTLITGEACPLCDGTGRGRARPEFRASEELEPVTRLGGWLKALAKAVWG